MVNLGPDPPNLDELTAPNCTMPTDPNENDSDEDRDAFEGYAAYQQLSQDIDSIVSSDNDDDTNTSDEEQTPTNSYLSPIETEEQEVSRQRRTAPRTEINIEKAQQNVSDDEHTPSNNYEYLPPIETVEQEVIRQVWTAPRTVENIEMNIEKAQQVMSAMVNFTLPATSIPDWANTLTEDQWKQKLSEKIMHLNGKQ